MLSCKANPVLVQCLGFPHSSDPLPQLWDPCPHPAPPSPALGSPQPLKPKVLWLTRSIPSGYPLEFCRDPDWLPSASPQGLALRICSGKVMEVCACPLSSFSYSWTPTPMVGGGGTGANLTGSISSACPRAPVTVSPTHDTGSVCALSSQAHLKLPPLPCVTFNSIAHLPGLRSWATQAGLGSRSLSSTQGLFFFSSLSACLESWVY